MSKNYDVIHYIQKQLSSFNDKALTQYIVNVFNEMYKRQMEDGCLALSAESVVAFRYLGYNANLIIGKMYNEINDCFYHAWIELDNIVIDIAGYGNSNWHPFYKGKKWDYPMIDNPNNNSSISYHRFEFDDDYPKSQISKAHGVKVSTYFNQSPRQFLWDFLFSHLGIPRTQSNYNMLFTIADSLIIGETPTENHD